jgi:hypothetical protein
MLGRPVVKALSNGKVGPRQCTLPTYLPKVDVPRPPPPTCVGARRPNVRWGGGTYVRAERPNVSGNVQRQRGQATSLRRHGRARTSLSE